MKKRNRNFQKEILIFMALLIIIMLIIAVALYDFIPSTVSIPETISYSSDSETTSIKQEIAYTNAGDSTADESANGTEKSNEDIITSLKSYSINASDLTVYGQKNLYNSGNSNPFDYAEDTQATTEQGKTADGTNTTANNTTSASDAQTNTTTNSATGTFFERANTK